MSISGVGAGGGFPKRKFKPSDLSGLKGWWEYDSLANPISVQEDLLLDGDMETAGTGLWESLRSTLSKSTTSPHSGNQCLQITSNGTSPTAYARQSNILIVGAQYRIKGWAKSDGTGIPKIGYASFWWTGTNSTTWQAFDFTVTNDHANFGICGDVSTTVYFDDITITPINILPDGYMELDGYTYWTATQSILSKQTSTPHSGNQCLRVAYDGSHAIGNANQTVLTSGNTYRIIGYLRSDGSATPIIQTNGSQTLFTGTTSTSWQGFDVTFISNGTAIVLTSVSSAGHYSEFDDISIELLNVGRFSDWYGLADPLADGYMDTDGYSAWTAYQTTLSKQTTSPHSGTQCLRVAYNGVNTEGSAYQQRLTTGVTYRITGWARGCAAGTAYPAIICNTVLWTGTTSTSWQPFDITFTCANAQLHCYVYNLAAGRFCEFDDIVCTPCTKDYKHLLQTTKTKRPRWIWDGTRYVLRFTGTTRTENLVTAAMGLMQINHLFVCVKPLISDANIRCVVDGNSSSTGLIYYNGGNIYLYAGAILTGPASTGSMEIIDSVISGTTSKIAVNGGAQTVGNAGSTNMFAISVGSTVTGGPYPLYGDIYGIVAYSRELTEPERQKVISYFKRKAKIT